jgi:glycosyltransferase involved in cell wall biosynthesis
MTPLRIGHVIQRYPPALGGAESYVARLSRFLAGRGHRVDVHTSNAESLTAFWSPRGRRVPAGVRDEEGVRVHRHAVRYFPGRKVALKALSHVPHPWVQGLTLPASPQLPSLWAHARRSSAEVDVVHASAFPYAFPLFCALAWARRRGVPFVLTPFLHLGDPAHSEDRTRRAYLSPPLRYLLMAADRLFVQTRLEQEAVVQQGVPAERVVLQGLGVEPAECTGGNRGRASAQWSLPDDGVIRIGHLANLSEEKGSVDLLKAVGALLERGVKCRVVLAGPVMPNFRRAWRTVPTAVKQQTHYLGVLSDLQKRDFYSAIEVFALPSRSDSFGLVLLEAWANGVPCVAYRAGGVAEVVRHDQDGLLAPCGEVTELARHLECLVRDDELRRRLGQAGQERVRHEHQWEDKLLLVEREYQALRGAG